MQIPSNLIASLKGKDYPVQEVLTGAYWTGVVSRGCGLASTFRDEGHPHKKGVKDLGHLTEKSALELAEYALSPYAMEASIGMASINSLIEVDEKKCIEKNASEILLEKGAGKDVAIIGIHVLSGTIVIDKEEAFRWISQGATFREVRGVRRVTMMKE